MAVATVAFFLYPQYGGAAGDILQAYGSQMAPEGSPSDLWGQGTPGAFPPFTTVNKGSTYREVNATDNVTAMWMKVDEGGDADDWTRIFAEDDPLIATADLLTAAGVLIEQLETNARVQVNQWGGVLNLADSTVTTVVFHAVAAITLVEMGLIFETATEASIASTITIADSNSDLVAAVAYTSSAAVGAYQVLTIADTALIAGEDVRVTHTQSANETGSCRLIVKYHLVS